jgi:hypothetical protein
VIDFLEHSILDNHVNNHVVREMVFVVQMENVTKEYQYLNVINLVETIGQALVALMVEELSIIHLEI